MKKVRWDEQERPRPRHPLRDSLIVYAVMAGVLVVVVVATGGSVLKGVIAAVAFFAASTAFSWWRSRARSRAGDER